MKTFLLLFLVAAAWHFVYEGIIAPSIRLHLRNRLFVLRDELRQARIDGIPKEDVNAFSFVHDGINNFLNRLPSLTLERTNALSREYERNAELRHVLDAHVSAVAESRDSRIRSIFHKTNSVIEAAIITNMGGWFIYIVPVALVIAAMSKLSRFAAELIVAPTKDVERFLPNAHA